MSSDDSLTWARVRHAYGPAGDLPALFNAVRESPVDAGPVIADLWSALCHQETVYDASALAVPTLLELARLPELSSLNRASLLMLVVSIGRGRDTCWDGYVPWETVERCAAAVEAVIPGLTNWGCSTDDAVVHAAALAAAAYFPTSSEGRLELLAPDDGDPQLLVVRRLLEAKARGDLTAEAIVAAAALDPDVADYAADADQDDPSFGRTVILELAFGTAT